ncbi:MAG: PRC-barrel domain containing protein [Sphingomonadaceae bacterium]|nr:PRC-barrel domain containing protein [Sphingomonadaceae bacterium]
MNEVAGWVAPIATMIAAMMTAANLGARVTGWGFVVFTVGSVAWTIVAIGTGQTNLLATNGFLTLVNLVGIWRWLGRQATVEDSGAKAAEAGPLTPLGALIGARVEGPGGEAGKIVEAMAESDGLRLNYVIVSTGGVGGVGEALRAIPVRSISVRDDGSVATRLTRAEIDSLPPLQKDHWPAAL